MTAALRRRGHLSLVVSASAGEQDATGAVSLAAGAAPALGGVPAAPSAEAVPAAPRAAGPDIGDLPADAAALVRLVSGAPVATPACDLIAFANGDWAGLDPARDPNGYTLAEVTLAWFHTHVGVERRTGGVRAGDLASDLQRYLLPFALEFDAEQPGAGVSRLRLQHAKRLMKSVSGGAPLPAATVAGDLLGRTGLASSWLTLPDAAAVAMGGLPALREAVARGALTLVTVEEVELVRPLWLREADLLIGPDEPHGLAATTQTTVLRTLRTIIDHARDLGADVRGTFDKVTAIEPLPHQRLRPPSQPPRFVPLAELTALGRHLAPVFQLALWLMRMAGLRIGEAYGLSVGDITERGGRMWLAVTSQGGQNSLVRSEDGQLRWATSKPDTKTRRHRTVPMPAQLADLVREVIRVFHTDADTGEVNTAARLIPGIGSDDTGGISALYSALEVAFAALRAEGHDVVAFNPHDLRYSVVTALANAGVDKRLRRWYLGHHSPQDVHEGYDLGPQGDELVPVADVLTALAAEQAPGDLRVPTSKAEQWGSGTRRAATAHLLRAELLASGWLRPLPRVELPGVEASEDPAGDPPVSAADVARLAGIEPQTARKLLRTGVITGAHQRLWGNRMVWYTHRSHLDAYLARSAATVDSLAVRLGYSYHQTWTLLVHLGVLDPDRAKGGAIRLTAAAITAVDAEVARREEAAGRVMLLDEAERRAAAAAGHRGDPPAAGPADPGTGPRWHSPPLRHRRQCRGLPRRLPSRARPGRRRSGGAGRRRPQGAARHPAGDDPPDCQPPARRHHRRPPAVRHARQRAAPARRRPGHRRPRTPARSGVHAAAVVLAVAVAARPSSGGGRPRPPRSRISHGPSRPLRAGGGGRPRSEWTDSPPARGSPTPDPPHLTCEIARCGPGHVPATDHRMTLRTVRTVRNADRP
ncbi:tyrosine-type recombinase/integrase [Blastococcus deserti]|uniref:Tyrosine-type recombinase/integrase n=1 Tax=Blastococcus deserti TaxID=2259033 RepID=A0ABW4X767_9ACTN